DRASPGRARGPRSAAPTDRYRAADGDRADRRSNPAIQHSPRRIRPKWTAGETPDGLRQRQPSSRPDRRRRAPGLAGASGGPGLRDDARRKRHSHSAPLRPVRTLRRAEEITHRRQHRARRHTRAPGHLPARGRPRSSIRRAATRCVHRRTDAVMKPLGQWLAVALLVGVQGCAVGPDYRTPALTMPDACGQRGQRGVTSTTPDLQGWWRQFRDPVLDMLIDRAIARNLDLRVAIANVREARAFRGVAGADQFPSVNASGLYSRVRDSQNVRP